MNAELLLKRRTQQIERGLEKRLSSAGRVFGPLVEAMRYAVLSGGKRIRPILALEACHAVGGREAKAMPAACAIELIHSYSLVHDDLPCMDDDAERRGQATCHVKFGEATAVLAGDALLTMAFQILSETQLSVVRFVAEAAGVHGMVGGQAMDMAYQGRETDLPTLECLNARKSGALIAVSLKAGAVLGGGNAKQVEALSRFGKTVGLLFQVVDDIMDGQGYATLLGAAQAREEAGNLLKKAKTELRPFGKRAETLLAIADFIRTRDR